MKSYLNITTDCTSCDSCRLICPEDSIFVNSGEYYVDSWSCTICFVCVEICPEVAIKLVECDDTNDSEDLVV